MKKVLICIMVMAIMATTLVLFAGCQKNAPAADNDMYVVDDTGAVMQEGVVHNMPQSLTFMSSSLLSVPSSASPSGLTAKASVTLTATVLPDTANNKLVDWYVAWAEPESAFAAGKDVREYVNIFPSSDGSTTVTLECYQAFVSDIINITVVTREGAFSAVCAVSFKGVPEGMSFSTTNTYDGDYILLVPNVDNVISLNLLNAFDYVSSEYYVFSSALSGTGDFVMRVDDDFGGYTTHTVDSGWFVGKAFPNYSYRIENGNLIINPVSLFDMNFTQRQFFVSDAQYQDFGLARFNGYSGATAGFKFEVTHSSGLKVDIRVRIASRVTGVSTNASYIF